MKTKTCPLCKEEKPLSEYDTYFSKPRNKRRPQNYCRVCSPAEKRRRSREYYKRNKNKRLEYAKKYRNENKDKLRIQKRKFKRKYVKELHSTYVSEQAAQVLKIPQRIISQQPEMVEAYKNILKLKRKMKEHGKK